MNKFEVLDTIYDTIMGNIGMSKRHDAFPTNLVSNQYISASRIYFEIEGRAFHIKITEVEVEEYGNI